MKTYNFKKLYIKIIHEIINKMTKKNYNIKKLYLLRQKYIN